MNPNTNYDMQQLVAMRTASAPTPTANLTLELAATKAAPPKAKRGRKPNKSKGNDSEDKPRRPLSAYNYFFSDQRLALVAERDERVKKAKEAGGDGVEEAGNFFGELAKVIASRWKEIGEDDLQGYKVKAELDSKRYRDEMDEFKNLKRFAPKTDAAGMKSSTRKPRRPLSAYNYFFSDQRLALVAERDERVKKAKEAGGDGVEETGNFFGELAKMIASRWKEIRDDDLQTYKSKAELDSQRYRDEMDEFNRQKKAKTAPEE